ncbi:hypothetical protein CDL15_Pgr021950 [Punica granatum]|uniref:Uncharacterized protein n=1 Tax=Punica granatum TaxID=22663 RepID=A0A218WCK1_PUNGR|nr:hypothetical protein CDL15_Pgr021950 [Punica granatum]
MGAQEDVRRAGVCGSARGAGACGSGGARASASKVNGAIKQKQAHLSLPLANFGLPNEDEDECEPSILHVEEAKALMSIDEGLSVVFKLLDIFKQECKLASCIEEEEASRIKGDSSWASEA